MNARSGTSGVDWAQAANIGKSLLLSPIVGFALAAALFLALQAVVQEQAASTKPPKAPNRRRSGFAACSSSPAPASASSTAPTTAKKAWASSCSSSSAPFPPPTRSTTPSPRSESQDFVAVSSNRCRHPEQIRHTRRRHRRSRAKTSPTTSAPRNSSPTPCSPCANWSTASAPRWRIYEDLKAVPQDQVRNFRNDMYLASEALRLMQKSGKPEFSRRATPRS